MPFVLYNYNLNDKLISSSFHHLVCDVIWNRANKWDKFEVLGDDFEDSCSRREILSTCYRSMAVI